MFVSQLQAISNICVKRATISRHLSFTAIIPINQKWREERGLPMNPNAQSVLADSADYTFLDGRPTPYGANQKRRMMKQKEIAERIIALTKEVDFAVTRYEQMKVEEAQARQRILDRKLKPKGKLLLKK